MNQSPKVSIIMNCHNSETYLKEAINSIYSQTYTDWEIIFWDNNSSDKSSEIAKSYDDKIRYFRGNKTIPLGEARFLATQKCEGKYLAFLDCDDIWYEDKLTRQLELFRKEGPIGFVYGKANIIKEERISDDVLGYNRHLPEGNIFNELLKEDFIPFPSALIDLKKFWSVGGFPKHFYHAPDYWIFLHLAKKFKVYALQEPCCAYRIHQSNLSHSQKILCSKESIEVVKKFLPDKNAYLGLENHKVTLAISYFRTKNFFKFILFIPKVSLRILFLRILNKFYFSFFNHFFASNKIYK
tara:strand:- start:22 stop:912 length:891 start_codon:yes stop_codon:yes gene_type:complete